MTAERVWLSAHERFVLEQSARELLGLAGEDLARPERLEDLDQVDATAERIRGLADLLRGARDGVLHVTPAVAACLRAGRTSALACIADDSKIINGSPADRDLDEVAVCASILERSGQVA
jgi:hypothetical protein